MTTLVASCDEGTVTVVQERLTNIIYLIFCKVLFPYATFVSKTGRDGLEGEILVDEELGALRQQVMVSDFMSKWRLVASGVPHGSGTGPVVLNIFNDTASAGSASLQMTQN